MFSLEQLLSYITGAIVLIVISIFIYVRLKRKYDGICFLVGYWILMIFLILIYISPFEHVSSLLSSLVIAELTLALVWVELSKRPELKLLDFTPIVRGTDFRPVRAVRSERELSKPSRLLKIRKASFPDTNLKFDKYFSFAVDLSNIGYSEIMVHELYICYLLRWRKEIT